MAALNTLFYFVNTKSGVPTVDVDISIENLNKSIPYPLYVSPHTTTTSYNTYITFRVESPVFLEFEKYYDGPNLTVFNTNDDILTKRIFPKIQRNKFALCK